MVVGGEKGGGGEGIVHGGGGEGEGGGGDGRSGGQGGDGGGDKLRVCSEILSNLIMRIFKGVHPT